MNTSPGQLVEFAKEKLHKLGMWRGENRRDPVKVGGGEVSQGHQDPGLPISFFDLESAVPLPLCPGLPYPAAIPANLPVFQRQRKLRFGGGHSFK